MDKDFLQIFDSNIQGKFSYLPSQSKKMHVQLVNGIVLIDSGLHSNMFNIAYCNGTTDRASLKTAMHYFNSKNLPYAFWVGFEKDPSWLEDELLSLGFTTEETESAMICKTMRCKMNKSSTLKHADFNIRQVQNPSEIIHVMNHILPLEEHVAIQSFYEQFAPILLSQDSSLTFFVGYENQRPVSLSSLFCDQKIASIFDLIVLPEMRGKGLGKAMTLKAMLNAQEKGFDTCVLTATNDAKYLYQKLGFESFKTMKVYQQPTI